MILKGLIRIIKIILESFSKKEEKSIYDIEKQVYFTEISSDFKNTEAEEWLQYFLESKENPYRMISQKYDDDKILLKRNLNYVCKAYNSLTFKENTTVRLALFSSMLTKDPQTFDINSDCGKLLVSAISYRLKVRNPENAEELSEVLYRAGIIKDEVSNYTLCSGILAYNGEEEHLGWRGFYDNEEPLQLYLWNISKVDKIISPSNKVYVFENPTVFSEVLYRIGNIKPSLL